MLFFLILFNIANGLTIILWFQFATYIFVKLDKKNKTKGEIFEASVISISFAYPFILAYCLYSSWTNYEMQQYDWAISWVLLPLIIFLLAFLYRRHFRKN